MVASDCIMHNKIAFGVNQIQCLPLKRFELAYQEKMKKSRINLGYGERKEKAKAR
jgi:hypothetical protein